ncbi:hypothetical protein QJS66_02530 [Kocuria rhizophila]|nr:hypothetical protein QJS66_02530 [Kocuria rhizophila]
MYPTTSGTTWASRAALGRDSAPAGGGGAMPKCVLSAGDRESRTWYGIDRRQGQYPTDPCDLVAALRLDSSGRRLLPTPTFATPAMTPGPVHVRLRGRRRRPSFVLATLDG